MNYFINKYDLFIFDLDDTLVKTENFHYNAWLNILRRELGNDFYIDFDFFISKFHSVKSDNIKSYLINELGIQNYEEIIQKKNKYYLDIINRDKTNIILIEGALELIEKIIEQNKKFVIVSNSVKSNIDYFSELFPILKKSSKNYYRELLTNKKPHPECYLKVVEDFPDNRMVGFEDSVTGIHAMTQVKTIDTIFINNSSYYYYSYIIKNYNLSNILENYNSLKNL
uniref:FCP1 homology domain-containing protein n=1 Tax=viral metagenome TaxID=1070528 RepID=A0A6C0BB40_9ZZZZ